MIPVQNTEYLGLIIHSVNTSVLLTSKKKQKIADLYKLLLSQKRCLVRDIAKLLGCISFSFIAVKFSKLHYWNLKRNKIFALAVSSGKFDSKFNTKQDIEWWINNITDAKNDLHLNTPNLTVTTDASLQGWGAVTSTEKTGRVFPELEGKCHINVLELKAVLLCRIKEEWN